MKSLVRFTLAVTTAVALATTFALAQSDQAYGHRRAQTHAGAQGQPLTGPSNASPVAIIAQYLRGLGRNVDVQSLVRESAGQGNSGTIRVEQRVGGVRVYGAYAKATLSGRGELVHLIENLVATPGAVSRARVSEADALAATLRYLYPDDAIATGPGRRQGDTVRFERTAFFHQDPTVTRVVYPAADGSFGAGFVVTTWTEEKNLLHETLIGPGGEVLFDELRTNSDAYAIFRINPTQTGQDIVAGPAPGESSPSPNGWLLAVSQNTINIKGNNVNAYLDAVSNNAADSGGTAVTDGNFLTTWGAGLSPSTAANRDVAVQNLFYLNNVLHDALYPLGFNEAAGNFQEDNFGNGGAGSDSVNAEAQDGGGTDNANFATPTDGSNPRMQMYLWNGGPDHEVNVGGTGYKALRAGFGPTLTIGGVTYPLAVTAGTNLNGCSSYSGMSNSIVIVNRGDCDFVVKVQNAQNAGAKGVVVANNVGSTDVIVMGGTSRKISIPSVMVGQTDGGTLRTKVGQVANLHKLATTPIMIDADLDADIVFHEYGHGLTWRMIGGMSGALAGAIGEGAGDTLAMFMTYEDDQPNADAMGEYSALSSNGIRRYRYDLYPADMTYRDVTGAEVHDDGEIYAAIMWNLIEQFGARRDVLFSHWVQGMNFTPSTPAYEDMRDGMLAAVDASSLSAAQKTSDKCDIWRSFAARGVGVGADGRIARNRLLITESMTLPAECQ